MPKNPKPTVPPLDRSKRQPVKNGRLEQLHQQIEAQAIVPAEAVIGTGPDSDPKPLPPTPAKPLVVLPSASVSLTHSDGRQYDFHKLPDRDGEPWVAVVLTGRYQFSRVEMPRSEGTYLWRRLRDQGFTQF